MSDPKPKGKAPFGDVLGFWQTQALEEGQTNMSSPSRGSQKQRPGFPPDKSGPRPPGALSSESKIDFEKQTLFDVLRHHIGLKHFTEYSKTEDQTDNLLFWSAVNRYKTLESSQQLKDATQIMKDFILHDAPHKIGLDVNSKTLLTSSVEQGDIDNISMHLVRIQKEDMEKMKEISFQRFKASKFWASYKQEATEHHLARARGASVKMVSPKRSTPDKHEPVSAGPASGHHEPNSAGPDRPHPSVNTAAPFSKPHTHTRSPSALPRFVSDSPMTSSGLGHTSAAGSSESQVAARVMSPARPIAKGNPAMRPTSPSPAGSHKGTPPPPPPLLSQTSSSSLVSAAGALFTSSVSSMSSSTAGATHSSPTPVFGRSNTASRIAAIAQQNANSSGAGPQPTKALPVASVASKAFAFQPGSAQPPAGANMQRRGSFDKNALARRGSFGDKQNAASKALVNALALEKAMPKRGSMTVMPSQQSQRMSTSSNAANGPAPGSVRAHQPSVSSLANAVAALTSSSLSSGVASSAASSPSLSSTPSPPTPPNPLGRSQSVSKLQQGRPGGMSMSKPPPPPPLPSSTPPAASGPLATGSDSPVLAPASSTPPDHSHTPHSGPHHAKHPSPILPPLPGSAFTPSGKPYPPPPPSPKHPPIVHSASLSLPSHHASGASSMHGRDPPPPPPGGPRKPTVIAEPTEESFDSEPEEEDGGDEAADDDYPEDEMPHDELEPEPPAEEEEETEAEEEPPDAEPAVEAGPSQYQLAEPDSPTSQLHGGHGVGAASMSQTHASAHPPHSSAPHSTPHAHGKPPPPPRKSLAIATSGAVASSIPVPTPSGSALESPMSTNGERKRPPPLPPKHHKKKEQSQYKYPDLPPIESTQIATGNNRTVRMSHRFPKLRDTNTPLIPQVIISPPMKFRAVLETSEKASPSSGKPSTSPSAASPMSVSMSQPRASTVDTAIRIIDFDFTGRQLIRSGLLRKFGSTGLFQKLHSRMFYLFNDIIVWTNPETGKQTGAIPLQDRAIHVTDQQGEYCWTGFCLESELKALKVVCATAQDKSDWKKDIEAAVAAFEKERSNARKQREEDRTNLHGRVVSGLKEIRNAQHASSEKDGGHRVIKRKTERVKSRQQLLRSDEYRKQGKVTPHKVSLEQKQGSDSRGVQLVSRPFNVEHKTHVDKNYEWWGQNLEEVFVLVERLGKGSFGEVWKARHREAKFELAVKMVPAPDQKSPDFDKTVQIIKDEIEILKLCRNSNIVSYYGCWGPDSNGRLWILMDLCEIGSLGDLVDRTGTQLTERQVAYIIAGTLRALLYLHTKNIIHRDIKANNVLLTLHSEVKLADFGVSQQKTESSKLDDIVGTPLWMAPEVVKGAQADFAADIWSLGVTCIEIAEGAPPHANLKVNEVLQAILTSPSPKLNRFFWSQHFRDFVNKCVIKDPRQRPDSLTLMSHPFITSAPGKECLVPLIKRFNHLGPKGIQFASYDLFHLDDKTAQAPASDST